MAVMTKAQRLWSGSSPRQRAALALFVGLAVVHLGAQLAGASSLAGRSQWFLMPALALVVAAWTARPRTRRVRLVLVALGLSWLGDTVPDLVPEGVSFLVMVGFFLLAQVCYITAFVPGARRSSIVREPARAWPYALAFVVLVVLCAPGAGSIIGPVIVYGACLTMMAVLATGLAVLGLRELSNVIYTPQPAAKPGYAIQVAETTGGGGAAEAPDVPPDKRRFLFTADVMTLIRGPGRCRSRSPGSPIFPTMRGADRHESPGARNICCSRRRLRAAPASFALRSWSSRIFSSTVPVATSLKTKTAFV